MVIGLAYGKTVEGDDAATEKTRAITRRVIDAFTAKNGSVNCTAPLGYDLSSPDEYAKAQESGIFIEKCPLPVRDAAEIVEKNSPE